VTPGGSPRREPGQPVPPLTVFHFDQKILAAQKPMTYTDLLGDVYLLHFKSEVDQDLAIHTKNHIQDWLTHFFVLPLTSLIHNLHELL